MELEMKFVDAEVPQPAPYAKDMAIGTVVKFHDNSVGLILKGTIIKLMNPQNERCLYSSPTNLNSVPKEVLGELIGIKVQRPTISIPGICPPSTEKT